MHAYILCSNVPSVCAVLPGGWTDGGVDSADSRPQRQCDDNLLQRYHISPQGYHKSEKLDLDFWDPLRLAAHVLATLPSNNKAEVVDFILEKKISGAFLARYAYQFDEMFQEEDYDLVRKIANTVPSIFWLQWFEPSRNGLYRLRDLVEDLRGVSFITRHSHIEGEFDWDYDVELANTADGASPPVRPCTASLSENVGEDCLLTSSTTNGDNLPSSRSQDTATANFDTRNDGGDTESGQASVSGTLYIPVHAAEMPGIDCGCFTMILAFAWF
ncbi:hypothetical protein B0F90DRAFT_1820217 [Multifurca ochricompacta]|uniref:Uncharacterized protein n=1 Tax=Multifurca ochricompacta TaxID=376703 RepID=A0AAD4LZK7_9AGAM|nr:hypothetical protein B0F90DRAFT_1820217 [Multifurca ochricompacta]